MSSQTPTQSTIRFWFLAFVLFAGLVWLFKAVLAPFVTGLIVAYFLVPAVDALEKRRVPRWLGALLALLSFILIAVALVILVWPMLNSQIGMLLNALPDYVDLVRDKYLPWVHQWLTRFSPEDVEKIRGAAAQSAGEAASFVGHTVRGIVSGGFALIDAVAMSIVMPVTAFYALLDWKMMTEIANGLIPRRYYAVAKEQLGAIDDTLSGFMRGQAMVCLALGLVYSIGLALCGLQYGATIGIVAGILTFIPYVGTIFGWAAGGLLAFVQFDNDWFRIGAVLTVFLIGHILEGYVLTPRFVGSRVGLHPLWILFALIAGGNLMGFTGVLIAVPTAAVIGVLVRFAYRQYLNSAVYK